MCLSIQIALKIRFLIQYHLLDSVFLLAVSRTAPLKFVFESVCAPLCFQDSRVSGTKRYWFADLKYLFGVAQSDK